MEREIAQRLLDALIIGALSAGMLAALLAILSMISLKVRGRPLIQLGERPKREPKPSPFLTKPLTQPEMVERLRVMANDPYASSADREAAQARLLAFDELQLS